MVHTKALIFSGSDSAPHLITAKRSGVDGKSKTPAGVFTQAFAMQYVILAIEEAIERGAIEEVDVTQERLGQFLSSFGRQSYKLSDAVRRKKIVLQRQGARVPSSIKSKDGKIEVVHSRAGTTYSV